MITLSPRVKIRSTSKKIKEVPKNEKINIENGCIGLTISEIHPQEKEIKKKSHFKRLSPFFMIALCLPVIGFYLAIKENTFSIKAWQLSVLVFIEVNIVFSDFALVNFFNGKKKLLVWLIETCLTTVLIFLLTQLHFFS